MQFFCHFLFILSPLCLYSLLPASIKTGCSLKKIHLSLSCVSGTITVSVLDVRRFIEDKTSTSVSPISSNSLFGHVCLFVERLPHY